uniref:C-type lectin domain-containing protein n=1 Tax=Panagrolaimus superbus TaxID=310955 RepID=A0A914Y2Y4_9BILA
MMHLVKEFELLAICCIFFVKFSTVSANPTLEGFECTGEKKWKIAKFDKIYCYTRVRAPAAKNEAVISNNYCGQIDRASHPASIHSLAENNFLENTFINGFIGLFQPGYGGYNPGLYRWEDGTPLNFVHWDRGFHLKPQPNNDSPIERLTRLRKNRKFHGWHDWIAKDIDYVICKKPATKIPVATPKATENPSTLAETIATTQISEAPKTQPLKPEELVDPPRIITR